MLLDKEVILETKTTYVIVGFKGVCELCGEEFVGKPQGGGRYRKYCSERCRYRRYRSSSKGREVTRRYLASKRLREKDV